MASAAATAGQGATADYLESPPRIVRLWRDTTRVEQLARFRALELQAGDDYGQNVWQVAYEAHRDLPDGVRIDLPSPRVFGRVLGLFRTGATLKNGKLLRLEISAQDIADLLGYSKATVEACLRWLESGPIEYLGQQVARGLGIIHRGRRTAWAFLEGIKRRVYRTSRLVLTLFGRVALGLGDRDEERKKERRQQRRQQKQQSPAPTAELASREQKHVQGQGNAGAEGDAGDPDAAAHELGRSWFRSIISSL